MNETAPALIVGGTGHLGGLVVDELLARGKRVRALVRPGSNASKLEAKGVEFRQDTMDSGVCHMAYFADPDGNALMLHHRYEPRVAEG